MGCPYGAWDGLFVRRVFDQGIGCVDSCHGRDVVLKAIHNPVVFNPLIKPLRALVVMITISLNEIRHCFCAAQVSPGGPVVFVIL